MIKDGNKISIYWNMACLCMGFLFYCFMLDSTFGFKFFVGMVTSCLIFTVLYNYKQIIRPMSYFILSFVVFVWSRILLNICFGTDIISIGNGINDINIHRTTYFLGILMCGMVAIAIVVTEIMNSSSKHFLLAKERICVNSWFSVLIVVLAIVFFILFLADSIAKINVIKTQNYLSVSESIMLEGYNYFRIGKYLLILWILVGKNEKRVYISSIILVIASCGYLMRGARGYAICYFFMWLLLYAREHKIRIISLLVVGLGLIMLANWIIEYRMGLQLTNGMADTIIKTLHSQGASIEPVFGALNFKKEILDIFPQNELLFRDDFGSYIDVARGVNFASGGFGTSFFAEVYVMGAPSIIFVFMMAIGVGIMEYAYALSIKMKNSYYELIIFLNCTNLIYFARSNIKNFPLRMITAYVMAFILISIARSGVGCLNKNNKEVRL